MQGGRVEFNFITLLCSIHHYGETNLVEFPLISKCTAKIPLLRVYNVVGFMILCMGSLIDLLRVDLLWILQFLPPITKEFEIANLFFFFDLQLLYEHE